MRGQPGIYVEILIQADLDRVWRLTQDPGQHQRWDLRFTRIDYLPRPSPDEPQRFLYETRIGFGITVRGEGESLGTRFPTNGDVTSALRFASNDPKSLIRTGAGYWKYVPTPAGLRFFTWYDYQTRFGLPGRLADRLVFRPLIGWATAWSFDCLRLWAEERQSPEASATLSLVHATARLTVAFVWIWHGLVPKLLYRDPSELAMLVQSNLPDTFTTPVGIAEILIGLTVLVAWKLRPVFPATILLMIAATAGVTVRSPQYLTAAFNPVTLNLSVAALALIGWLSSRTLPSAANCLRINGK